MTDYFQRQKEQVERINAETAHDYHRIEFREMCNQMIQDALREYDSRLEVDIQTTLNGKPTTMNGLVSDIKKQINDALRKAFKK